MLAVASVVERWKGSEGRSNGEVDPSGVVGILLGHVGGGSCAGHRGLWWNSDWNEGEEEGESERGEVVGELGFVLLNEKGWLAWRKGNGYGVAMVEGARSAA